MLLFILSKYISSAIEFGGSRHCNSIIYCHIYREQRVKGSDVRPGDEIKKKKLPNRSNL